MIVYELTGKIQGLAQDFATRRVTLTLSINEDHTARRLFDELVKAEKLSIKIGKYRQKRSLDANAYCFVLIDKLAKKLGLPKEEVYRNAIKEIGGVSEVVCVRTEAQEKLCESWARNGLGWQTDTFPSKLDGCTNVILYYGSSTYDSTQMNALIKNICEACQEQGIETKTPAEIASLLALWGE